MGTTGPPRERRYRRFAWAYWMQFVLLLSCVHLSFRGLDSMLGGSAPSPRVTNADVLLRGAHRGAAHTTMALRSAPSAGGVVSTADADNRADTRTGAHAIRYVTLHSVATGNALCYAPEAGIPESTHWLGANGAAGEHGVVFEVVELGASPDDETGVDAWTTADSRGGRAQRKQARPQGRWIALREAKPLSTAEARMLEVVPPSEEFAWVVRTSPCLVGDVCERHMLQIVRDADGGDAAEISFILSRFTRAFINVVDGRLRGHASRLKHKPAGMEPSARFRVVKLSAARVAALGARAASVATRPHVAMASASDKVAACVELKATMARAAVKAPYVKQWVEDDCEFLAGDGDTRAVPGTAVSAATLDADLKASTAGSSRFAGKFILIRCVANNRFVMPGGGGGGDPWLVAAGTEDTEVAHMAFEVVLSKLDGWVALRSRAKRRFVEAVPPNQPDAWVWTLKSTNLKERNLLKIEESDDGAKIVFIYSKFVSAHLNYLGANDLRAHGSKPRNSAPAGKEATARFELREVSSADLIASDARLAVKKLKAKSEASRAIAKIALLTQPPPGVKWIISFGLYGSNPKYTVGALENARLAKEFYPGWTVRMYHDDSVPADILEKLRGDGCELVKMHDIKGGIAGMFWRFLPASDPSVDRFIVRDTDSRLSARERYAVEDWIRSRKGIHSIRDHPNHDRGLNGGMWGGTKGAVPEMDRLVRAWSSRGHYGADLDFLNQRVWPAKKGDSYSTDSYTCHKWPNSHPFPVQRNADFEHVGQVFFADNTFRHLDIDNYMKGRHVPEQCRGLKSWLYG